MAKCNHFTTQLVSQTYIKIYMPYVSAKFHETCFIHVQCKFTSLKQFVKHTKFIANISLKAILVGMTNNNTSIISKQRTFGLKTDSWQ